MLHVLRTCCTIKREKCAVLLLMSTTSLPVLKRPPSRTSRDRYNSNTSAASRASCDKMGHMVKGRGLLCPTTWLKWRRLWMNLKAIESSWKRAKEAVNDAGIAAAYWKIKRDYSQLPKIIQKIESPKLSIAEASLPFPVSFIQSNSIRSILASHFRSQLQSRQRRHRPICWEENDKECGCRSNHGDVKKWNQSKAITLHCRAASQLLLLWSDLFRCLKNCYLKTGIFCHKI